MSCDELKFLKFLLQELCFVDPVVDPVVFNQFFMRAGLNDATLIENNDVVGVFDGRDPMRDEDSCPILHDFGKSVENGVFGLGIYVREGIIKDKDFGFNNNGACECAALTLPA